MTAQEPMSVDLSLQSAPSPSSRPASIASNSAKLAHAVSPLSLPPSNDIYNELTPSHGVYDEQNFDLFSTLFSPSTPRASPVITPVSLPINDTKSYRPPQHNRSTSMSSQSSDFGAFVSVSAFDDPLSAQFRDFDDVPEEPTTTTPENGTSGRTVESATRATGLDVPGRPASRNSTSSSVPSISSISKSPDPNPTLNFFDQFAQEAKERSSKRSSLLDELLLHEDDPLYFLKDQNLPPTPSTAVPAGPLSPPPPPPPPKSPLTAERIVTSPTPLSPSPPQSMSASSSTDCDTPPSSSKTATAVSNDDPAREFDLTHDLDHHYFHIPPSHASVQRPTPYSSPGPHVRNSPLHHNGRPSPPTRSSSIAVAEPRIAEPVTSIRLASGSPGTPISTSPPPAISFQLLHSTSQDNGDDTHDRSGHGLGQDGGQGATMTATPGHPPSSDSLGVLSSKWVSSLLRGAGSPSPSPNPANGGGARPALESIFNDPHNHPEPHHAQTLPPPSSPRAYKPIEPTFTHTSAFGPPPTSSSSVLSGLPPLSGTSSSMSSLYPGYPSTYSTSKLTHGTSPFAPHVYIPPSGAPGYAGEGYGGWDKGFSDELEREMRGGSPKDSDVKSDKDAAATQPQQPQSKSLPISEADAPREKDNVEGQGGGRGGWGSGFIFPFGSLRGRSGSANNVGSASRTSPKIKPDAEQPENNNSIGKQGPTKLNGNVSPHGSLGAFIEKKSGNIELLGRKEMTEPVLATELATKLRTYLPALARLPKAWSLIYSLDQNGISLTTLYSRCEAYTTRRPVPGEVRNTSMLFAVKDSEGGIFGAWLAEGVRGVKGNRGYFGGGESFLWKYVNDTLKVFKCTGKNNYVALCEPEYISFGGGDGHYGLYLDDTLFDGSSAPCPTFDNEPLCSPGPKKGSTVTFECVGLEVWGMGS